jgi:hypothetical protein
MPTTDRQIEPAVLDTSAAAAYCGRKPSTLAAYRHELCGPQFVKTSGARAGRVLYRVADLDAWLARGASRHERVTRPPQCPPGGFSRPDARAERGSDGRFARARHPGQ